MKSSKTQILWLIIVLLAILNIATISTVIYHNQTNQRAYDEQLILDSRNEPINGKYMRKHIGFDDKQMDTYRGKNHAFKQKAGMIISKIENQKELMLRELQASKPDTLELEKISTNIGEFHKELKVATYKFYLSIKDVCTPEQNVKLQQIFSPLFVNDHPAGGHRGNRGERKNVKSNNN